MIHFFNIVLIQPLTFALGFFYERIPLHDLGVSILIVTVIVRLILMPFSRLSIKSQKALNDLQPQLKEIKTRYPNQPDKQAQATMDIYKRNRVNPFSSCLLLLIQLPIIFSFYQVLRNVVKAGSDFSPLAFSVLDLSKSNIILAVVTALAQYWQSKSLATSKPPVKIAREAGAKDENTMAIMNKQMQIFLPLMTLFAGISLPSGLMLYWLAGLIFTIAEQKFFSPKKEQKRDNEIQGVVLPK
jgi:YidC/Oxa1 family membrane protein insertase